MDQPPVIVSTSSWAVAEASNSAPRAPGCPAAAPSWGCAPGSPGRGRRRPSPRTPRPPARGTAAGTRRGRRPGCPPAAPPIARRHLVVGEQPLHRPAGHQPVVEPLVGPHVGVLQVDQVQPRVAPAEPVAGAVALQQPQLGRPVQPVGAAHRVDREVVEHLGPAAQHVRGLLVGLPVRRDELLRLLQVHPLHLDRGELPAVAQPHLVGQRRVVADRLQRLDRLLDREVAGQRPRLDHGQHQRRRPDLEVRRDLGEVRVADDHVQPAVLVGVGVRLVAGVDDRPLQRRLQAHLDLEEVRPLRTAGSPACGPRCRCPTRPAPAKTCRVTKNGISPRMMSMNGVLPVHQVVLVRPVRGALAVGVVLVQLDRLGARDARPPGGPPRPSPAPPPCPTGRCRAGWSPPASSTPGARGRRTAAPRWSG